ncbi:MAG: ABC transporter ATP-binding protein [Candidatus Verstraetearchaeota archaeon]|nr:ABC transporter ATP-binding protein [Candidatus Verstraetearchaeota archaeon]
MALLEVKELSKHFGGVVALDGVNIKVDKGELVGIIGPNGAGKTTFYNCITGFYPPTSGKVFFDGKDVTGLPSHKLCRMGMARTFQIPRPFMSMTLLENVMVGALGAGMSLREAKEKAKEIVSFLKLEEQANKPISKLNFNYRRRCELARALATNPKLLMLDETFAGLNPSEIDEMVKLVRKIHESGVTIMLTEHVMKVVMSLAERIVVLHQGKVIAEGLPREVVNDSRVVEAYLGQRIFV